MPDAFNLPPAGKASATITICRAGVLRAPFSWIDSEQPHSVLSAISVFDKDCASVHVREKNEVAFRPFGLDIPDELARACQKKRSSSRPNTEYSKRSATLYSPARHGNLTRGSG